MTCVTVHVCVCVWMCMTVCLGVCLTVCDCVCLAVCDHGCLAVSVCDWLHTRVYVCAYLCMYVCVCGWVCLHVTDCIHMWVCVYVPICACVYVSADAYILYASVYVDVYVSKYMLQYLSMCWCPFLHICIVHAHNIIMKWFSKLLVQKKKKKRADHRNGWGFAAEHLFTESTKGQRVSANIVCVRACSCWNFDPDDISRCRHAGRMVWQEPASWRNARGCNCQFWQGFNGSMPSPTPPARMGHQHKMENGTSTQEEKYENIS